MVSAGGETPTGTEKYDKGNCIQNTHSFFEWLDSAIISSFLAGC